MKAVVIHQYGGVDKLNLEDVAIPVCGKDEVLVRVSATSVNPIDWKVRSGAAKDRMPIQFPYILGRDLAGEVVENALHITEFPAGTRVMALTNHTYAQFLAIKVDALSKIPNELVMEQAGALPLILTTGSQLIERAVKPKAGDTVLVTGALGSVGRTAVYTAKKLGAHVLAGVRSRQKDEAAELGADEVIALDDDTEIAKLHDLDSIADTIGGETITKLFIALKKGGVIGSVVGEPKGASDYDIRVEAFMAKPDPARLSELAAVVARGELKIPISKKLPMTEVQQAHELGESGKAGGKIVLIP